MNVVYGGGVNNNTMSAASIRRGLRLDICLFVRLRVDHDQMGALCRHQMHVLNKSTKYLRARTFSSFLLLPTGSPSLFLMNRVFEMSAFSIPSLFLLHSSFLPA